jgi:hypothetical protein
MVAPPWGYGAPGNIVTKSPFDLVIMVTVELACPVVLSMPMILPASNVRAKLPFD